MVDLVHPEETRRVSGRVLLNTCTLFEKNLSLLNGPYHIQSRVPLDVFRCFIDALEGNAVSATTTNIQGLSLLSSEFGFDGLSLRPPNPDPDPDQALHDRISQLETTLQQCRHRISALEAAGVQDRPSGDLASRLSRVDSQLSSLTAHVEQLGAVSNSSLERIFRLEGAVNRMDPLARTGGLTGALEDVQRELNRLRSEVTALSARVPAAAPR
jgi:prefoldin subunit 5